MRWRDGGTKGLASAAGLAAPPCAVLAALADGLDVAPWVVALPAAVAITAAAHVAWRLRAEPGLGAHAPAWCAVVVGGALGRWSDAALAAVLCALALDVTLRVAQRDRRRLDSAARLPRRARVWRAGRWVRCAAAAVQRGELARVLPRERVARDGWVRRGAGDVDQRALTGERERVPKASGDPLYAGSRNGAHALDYEVAATAPACLLVRSAAVGLQGLARASVHSARLPWLVAAAVVAGAGVAALASVAAGRAWLASSEAVARVPLLLALAWPFALSVCAPACAAAALAAAARRGIVFDGVDTLRRVAAATAIVLDSAARDARIELDGWQLLGVRHAPSRLLGVVRGLCAGASLPALAALEAAFDATPCVPAQRHGEAAGVAGRIDGVDYRLGEPGWVLGGAAPSPPLCSLLQLHRARACDVVLLGDGDGALALFALSRGVPPRSAAALDSLARLGVRGVLDGVGSSGAASRDAPRVVLDAAARGVAPGTAEVVVLAADPARAVDAVCLARRACAALAWSRKLALGGKALLLALALFGALTVPQALLGEMALGAAVLQLARRVRRAS